ncbi:cupin domain-containing protein [Candidatus Falkowbacteria bacterium]|uniref:Cupin domain-containing protein n=1 Tax=Candidatus Buchananbacteria bacterium CG10_big_fil_rev_8_21_14_0_10_33_19 TaxID=1974525 RepID=A0A2H0W3B6_9BACT|nr:cupin domain-containing protein [Candidatus Falkowbacteria bacterium]PIS05767.1 MAG: cupin domain-containing protein [Candidatus Buchananbacteria bacterium CG10_big_fil_rev_8_21_14_0_10_33_19]
MKGYVTNIEEKTLANNNFREVLYTGPNSQLVLMSLLPGEEIGMEIHNDNDQFLRIEQGTGKAILDDVEHDLADGSAVVVPAGTNHNIINTSETEDLKLYTIYSPAHHQDGVVFKTKAEAEASDEHFDGKTTE